MKTSPNSQLKVAIAGGGITGVYTALYCNYLGLPCAIYETRPALGGILCDWNVGSDWYFRNCQYLISGTDWFNLLPREHLFEFQNQYGSFTDLWGESIAYKGYAGPVYSLRSPLPPLNEIRFESLEERIKCYPGLISKPLLKWMNRFGLDLSKVHASGALGFQISRVFPLHFASKIQEYKSQSICAESLYGLPRSILGLSEAKVALPREGFTHFFQKICDYLDKLGVEINLKYTIKPDWIQKENVVDSFPKHSVTVWTGNPVPLVKKAIGYSLDSPSFRMKNIVGKWRTSKTIYPYYIQVFSNKSPITRIFVYNEKVTIECLDDTTPACQVVKSCIQILKKFRFSDVDHLTDLCEFYELRHFLCSTKDYKFFEELAKNNKNRSLIMSPWQHYGRDVKTQTIFNSLHKKLKLYCN